jgi:hypothetical protein
MWAYNCARVHVGSYVGGGTNEFEKWIDCKYQVLDGEILAEKMNPIKVRGTNSEGTIYTLETFILYPKTDTARIIINNGNRKKTIQLVKPNSQRTTMFKMRL